jgi:hypothetical protein
MGVEHPVLLLLDGDPAGDDQLRLALLGSLPDREQRADLHHLLDQLLDDLCPALDARALIDNDCHCQDIRR